MLFNHISSKSSGISNPAIHAVIKHTIQPEISALKARPVITSFFPGTKVPRAEIVIPTEPMFENPAIAYVVITFVRGCGQRKRYAYFLNLHKYLNIREVIKKYS